VLARFKGDAMSSIDVGIVITDYSWSEKSRPIVTLDEKQEVAHVQLGAGPDVYPITFEIKGNSREDLSNQLQGLSEIFAKAAEVTSR
jgi:hypothetical protein